MFSKIPKKWFKRFWKSGPHCKGFFTILHFYSHSSQRKDSLIYFPELKVSCPF